MAAESGATSDRRAGPQIADLQLNQSSGAYELVLGAVVFGLIGFLIDRQIGSTPLFLLIFSIAGLAGATISLYYRYKHRIAEIQAETEALRNAATGERR